MKRRPLAASSVWAAAAALAAVTLGLYARVRGFPFITNYDDGLYVTDNPHVRGGLTLANLAWAFTHTVASNWHPLTLLSHMSDVSLFGMDAGMHHLVNALLHSADAGLLLVVLVAYTGRLWPSAFVAGVFALHPLRVESVAWIAERKDVLSMLFWLATLLAYLRYTRTGRAVDLALTALLYALGLMAKPMLVTLPFVLMLLDRWPLERIGAPSPKARRVTSWGSLLEKWPLFLLALASVLLTLWAKTSSGATAGTTLLPLPTRLANMLLAYVRYLAKLVVPSRLAFLYPYAVRIPAAQVAGAGLLLAALTVAAITLRKRAPYVLFGWLWYLGTLVPVIGLVQVGSQSMADRYTYIPHIGILIVFAWGAADLVRRLRVPRAVTASVAALMLIACVVVSAQQLTIWSSPERLFEHGLEVTDRNYVAENDYAVELMGHGDFARAASHLERAVSFNRSYGLGLMNLGIADTRLQRFDQARDALARAEALEPRNTKVLLNLAFVQLLENHPRDAMTTLQTAMRLDPTNPECRELYAEAVAGGGGTPVASSLLGR